MNQGLIGMKSPQPIWNFIPRTSLEEVKDAVEDLEVEARMGKVTPNRRYINHI